MLHKIDWDKAYREERQLPWDTGLVAPELAAYIKEHTAGKSGNDNARIKNALEIGCGSGTNAIWMAQQNIKVLSTDLSPKAIEMAEQKKAQAGIDDERLTFKVADILAQAPADDASQDFVFDRGVFHVLESEGRETFARRAAKALKAGGRWLCIAGSKDEARQNPLAGPPQLSALEIVTAVEPYFEVIKIDRGFFVLPDGEQHLSWICVFAKREI